MDNKLWCEKEEMWCELYFGCRARTGFKKCLKRKEPTEPPCRNCGKDGTHRDANNVPLCQACWVEVVGKGNGEYQESTEKAVNNHGSE